MSENKHFVVAQFGDILHEERAIEATLAVAHEQRTANMIAWHSFVDAQGDLPDHSAELAVQIHERLGL